MLPEEVFPAVLELLPDAVIIVDREGTIEFVNAQTEALFGYERRDLTGANIETLVPEELRAHHERNRNDYGHRPGTRPMGVGLELWGRRKDATLFPVEISLSPLVRGSQMFITAVIRDMSDRSQTRSEQEQDRERQRIAMDLHDGTIQSIYSVGLGLELALSDLANDPVYAGRRIDAAIEELNDVIGDIRAYIFDLRPARYAGNLLHDLTLTVDEFRAGSSAEVVFEPPEVAHELREDRAAAMLQIARECLSNIRKHANAKKIAITLVDERQSVTLEIEDDGDGFDAAAQRAESHRGLRNMRMRTTRIGGVFDVDSTPGNGTAVRVRMPVSR